MYNPKENKKYIDMIHKINVESHATKKDKIKKVNMINFILDKIYYTTIGVNSGEITCELNGWSITDKCRLNGNGDVYVCVSQKSLSEQFKYSTKIVNKVMKLLKSNSIISDEYKFKFKDYDYSKGNVGIYLLDNYTYQYVTPTVVLKDSKNALIDDMFKCVSSYGVETNTPKQYKLMNDVLNNCEFINDTSEKITHNKQIKELYKKYPIVGSILKDSLDCYIMVIRNNLSIKSKLYDILESSNTKLNYRHNKSSLDKIFNADFNRISVDDFGRVHHSFSNISSSLRDILLKGGREFDLKNCQPLLFSYLLTERMNCDKITKYESTSVFIDSVQHGEIYEHIRGELELYMNDYVNVELEEKFERDLNNPAYKAKHLTIKHKKQYESLKNITLTKKDVKGLFFTIMFTNLTTHYFDDDYIIKKVYGVFMREKFTQVMQYMDKYNDDYTDLPEPVYRINKLGKRVHVSGAKEHKALACRLQMLESHLIYDCVIPVIKNMIDLDKYVIITIHDAFIIKAINDNTELSEKEATTIQNKFVEIMLANTSLKNVEIHNIII